MLSSTGLLDWTTDAQLSIQAYWLGVCVLCLSALLCPQTCYLRRAVVLCAGRGKLAAAPSGRQHERAWSRSRLQRLQVPHGWFWHFYAVGSACNGTVLLCHARACLQGAGERGDAGASLLALLLFQVHLMRRLVESTLMAHSATNATMHVGGYLFGLSFYLFASTSWLQRGDIEALVACAAGWGRQGLGSFEPVSSSQRLRASHAPSATALLWPLWHLHWWNYAGVAVFLFGSAHQFRCHRILAALRPAPARPVAASYSTPRGDWFEWVACAHYLAEIVIYGGLMLVSDTPLTACLMFAAVVSNLALAAQLTRSWYLQNVPGYPRHRAALFPGLL